MKNLRLIKSGIPEPDKDNPFAQIDYLFMMRGGLSPSSKTGRNYAITLAVYKDFLRDIVCEDGQPVAPTLKEAFPWDVHFRFYKWLVAQKGRFALITTFQHLSNLKQVVEYTRAHKFIRHEIFFVCPKMGNPAPTTQHRTAYDEGFYGPICDLLDKKYRLIKLNFASNIDDTLNLPGQDPRIEPPFTGDRCLMVLSLAEKMGSQGFTLNFCRGKLGIQTGAARRIIDFWTERGVFEEVPYGASRKSTGAYKKYVLKCQPTHSMLREAAPKTYGWKNLDNLIWFIFNEMEGRISEIRSSATNRRELPRLGVDRTFVNAIRRYHGGIKRVKAILAERSLANGDEKRVSATKIVTLMAMLAKLTGLNPESLADLQVDCLKKEPISGKPCLRYVKNRSKGKKVLALFDEEDRDLYSDSSDLKSDADGMLYFNLLPNAELVADVIETTIKVTELIRQKAPAEVANLLFIFESDKIKKVSAISQSNRTSWGLEYFKPRLAAHLKKRATKQDLAPDALSTIENEIDKKIAAANIIA